jgi:hypothetical protein
MVSGEDDSEDVGVRRTKARSPASVSMVIAPPSPSQRPLSASLRTSVSVLIDGCSRNLRGDPRRSCLRNLPPALPSTISSCRSALGTRAQISDLGIDSRGSLLWLASVTDNFGNLDNLGRGAPEQEKGVGVALSCGAEGILRRCLSTRLLRLSRLPVTGFGVGCPDRISQGASESIAASTQSTGSGGASGRPTKIVSLHGDQWDTCLPKRWY